MADKNFYKVLGVSESASADDIKKAYKKLARKYHPDANPDDRDKAEERFKEVSEAYYVLGDEKKRQEYDTMRRYGGGAGGAGYGASGFDFDRFMNRSGDGGKRFQNGQSQGYSMFGDIFSDLFSGGGGRQTFSFNQGGANGCSRTGPRTVPTADVQRTVTLSTEQASQGVRVKIKVDDGRSIMVNVPAGSRSGQKLRLARQGAVCECCGHRGDIVLTLRVQ